MLGIYSALKTVTQHTVLNIKCLGYFYNVFGSGAEYLCPYLVYLLGFCLGCLVIIGLFTKDKEAYIVALNKEPCLLCPCSVITVGDRIAAEAVKGFLDKLCGGVGIAVPLF